MEISLISQFPRLAPTVKHCFRKCVETRLQVAKTGRTCEITRDTYENPAGSKDQGRLTGIHHMQIVGSFRGPFPTRASSPAPRPTAPLSSRSRPLCARSSGFFKRYSLAISNNDVGLPPVEMNMPMLSPETIKDFTLLRGIDIRRRLH